MTGTFIRLVSSYHRFPGFRMVGCSIALPLSLEGEILLAEQLDARVNRIGVVQGAPAFLQSP